MLIKNEYVKAVYAFSLNGLIVTLRIDLLILRNWTVIQYIKDPVPANIEKCWLSIPPFFDTDEFPFIITSGRVSYNLVNLKSGQI